MSYPPERREAVLKKMLPPNQRSIPDLAKKEGIAEPTLYAWRKKARNEGRLMPDSNNTAEGWSSRDKFTAVLETATMSQAEVAEYCRRNAIHTSQIDAWREACVQANDWERDSNAKLKLATKAADKKNYYHRSFDRRMQILQNAGRQRNISVLHRRYPLLH